MKYFGTDGFRGRANEGLDVEHAYKIGRFVGWYYGARQAKKARVILGKDTRRSSYMFESALVSGLVASGADAYMLHVIPTPGVSFEVVDGAFDCGVMITASHNPYTDNGIKLVNREGYKMDEDVLELIEDYIDGKTEVPLATGDAIGCTVDYMQGRNRYISHLIASCGFSLQGLKIGLDCANGSASSVARPVFDALGAETHVINNAPNGFNINVDCGSTHIDQLQRFVVQNGLDVGFAYDGDADRCLAVDEKGQIITGDHILYICGRHMKELGELPHNTVVTTVMSNFGLYRAFDRLGIRYAKTAVGDKYVYEYMSKNGCALGGEQSGHIIFSKYASTGDGILTSLKLMEVMLERKQPMSKLTEGLTIYPQVLENVRVHDKAAARQDPAVQKAVDDVARRLGDTGRILVRESGTEPVLRVMVEAPEDAICRECVAQVAEIIRAQGHAV